MPPVGDTVNNQGEQDDQPGNPSLVPTVDSR